MRPSKTRFVTACQQLLALGVVLAVLTPAAARHQPGRRRRAAQSAQRRRRAARADARRTPGRRPHTSRVPTAPVDAEVTGVPLTAPAGARSRRARSARAPCPADGGIEVDSTPQPVTGYGAVGVTWEHGAAVADDAIAFAGPHPGRTAPGRTGPTSSTTTTTAPTRTAPRRAHARPGTDALLVGDVDEVQVRAERPTARAPGRHEARRDRPGRRAATPRASCRRSTPRRSAGDDAVEPTEPPTGDRTTEPTAWRSRARRTPRSRRSTRAPSGAPTSGMRDKGSLHYFEVHAGFVHHTVNANDYTRDEVPGIIRSIYAYHTQSRGWSDVGYNFLVDRFGRIWEGRYGGVDRPVVGAHTLGYNDYSFAMSAIGNFETAPPARAMLEAYGALFAWKLSLHGVNAASTKQWVDHDATSRRSTATATPARPPARASTSTPRSRRSASWRPQRSRAGAGAQLESNLAGSDHPDLVVRRASDGRPSSCRSGPPQTSYKVGQADRDRLQPQGISVFLNAGDWDRDGYGDIIFRSCDERCALPEARPGHRQVRAGAAGRLRLQRGPAAGRGRRHDRRRLAGPDGPAARRRDADLPRQGHRRAQARATSRTRAISADRQVPIGLLEPRRRPGQPVPHRRASSASTRATARAA